MSNFVVKSSDGTLSRVPVTYGDMDRQVASVINQNSENALPSAPHIAVYVSGLALDRERLSDATFESKLHIRERAVVDNSYTTEQGQNYTVERLMPTPYSLSVKVDIWSANSEQKLQILEQILMLFNPSLEIQTNDNFIDWTSLSVVDLEDIQFTSRSIPDGPNSTIDIATLSLKTPIWISPPAKVKRLGVVTNIISSVFSDFSDINTGYLSGLGVEPNDRITTISNDLPPDLRVSLSTFSTCINQDIITLFDGLPTNLVSWKKIIDQYPGTYRAGISKIYFTQPNKQEIGGTFTISTINDSELVVNIWDTNSLPQNTLLSGPARNSGAWGTFDSIINPQQTDPSTLNGFGSGSRYLLSDNIGSGIRETLIASAAINQIDTEVPFADVFNYRFFVDGVETASVPTNLNGSFVIRTPTIIPVNSTVRFELFLNSQGPLAWKNSDNSDFIADYNDIIEWDGTKWNIVFSAKESANTIVYQTNLFSMKQLLWNGISWVDAITGTYRPGYWRISL